MRAVSPQGADARGARIAEMQKQLSRAGTKSPKIAEAGACRLVLRRQSELKKQ